MTEEHECAYCGETFETDLDKGIHVADEHIETDQSIEQKSYAEDKRTDLIDEYEKNNKGKAEGGVA
jgi:hypothetical protein